MKILSNHGIRKMRGRKDRIMTGQNDSDEITGFALHQEFSRS